MKDFLMACLLGVAFGAIFAYGVLGITVGQFLAQFI
jgi:hypothetical protein